MYSTLVSAKTLYDNFTSPNWIVVDSRFDVHDPSYGKKVYVEGHIPKAVFVDLEKELSLAPDGTNGRHPLPAVEDLVNLLGSIGVSNDHQVVVYDDDGGGYAARLWWILHYLGHRSVAVLDGGFQSWTREDRPLSMDDEPRTPAHFEPQIQADRLISVDQLLPIHQDTGLLLDSRAGERYRGEEEPLDPVAGHIPGARNRPWRENLTDEGLFRSQQEIRSELGDILKGSAAREAIVYCGSGVTACHNLLAFVHAGLEMPRLYAGSWSEWCSDSTRPTATWDLQ
jgi:thiosulfate/3-mercaptopyruvate sulfurtransferase